MVQHGGGHHPQRSMRNFSRRLQVWCAADVCMIDGWDHRHDLEDLHRQCAYFTYHRLIASVQQCWALLVAHNGP